MRSGMLSRTTLLGLALTLTASFPGGAEAQMTDGGRVLATREYTLKAGADAQEFERYVLGEYLPALEAAIPGFRGHLLRGDRGERKGRYLVVWEFDSVARRDAYFPTEGGEASAQLQELTKSLPQSRLGEYAQYAGAYTDYLVLR